VAINKQRALCNAAALAAVGWYLMMPPWNYPHAPLSYWDMVESFDSIQECRKQRNSTIRIGAAHSHDEPLYRITRRGQDEPFDAARAACIATDDPRLK
jgi:hypothetical protein